MRQSRENILLAPENIYLGSENISSPLMPETLSSAHLHHNYNDLITEMFEINSAKKSLTAPDVINQF